MHLGGLRFFHQRLANIIVQRRELHEVSQENHERDATKSVARERVQIWPRPKFLTASYACSIRQSTQHLRRYHRHLLDNQSINLLPSIYKLWPNIPVQVPQVERRQPAENERAMHSIAFNNSCCSVRGGNSLYNDSELCHQLPQDQNDLRLARPPLPM